MKEYKRWIIRLVQRFGKKNGRVSGRYFDNPEIERKLANDKRNRSPETKL